MVRQLINKEDGASSVLIVVMMVVLIVFGLAIFSTALSNMRLADKKIAWKNEYYQLESNANGVIASIFNKVDEINAKRIDVATGFSEIDQILSEACSEREILYREDGRPNQITFNVADATGHKNIAIALEIDSNSDDDALKIRIIKFKEWQEHFEIDDSSPFSKCSPLVIAI